MRWLPPSLLRAAAGGAMRQLAALLDSSCQCLPMALQAPVTLPVQLRCLGLSQRRQQAVQRARRAARALLRGRGGGRQHDGPARLERTWRTAAGQHHRTYDAALLLLRCAVVNDRAVVGGTAGLRGSTRFTEEAAAGVHACAPEQGMGRAVLGRRPRCRHWTAPPMDGLQPAGDERSGGRARAAARDSAEAAAAPRAVSAQLERGSREPSCNDQQPQAFPSLHHLHTCATVPGLPLSAISVHCVVALCPASLSLLAAPVSPCTHGPPLSMHMLLAALQLPPRSVVTYSVQSYNL